jgi:hypothetical protein
MRASGLLADHDSLVLESQRSSGIFPVKARKLPRKAILIDGHNSLPRAIRQY